MIRYKFNILDELKKIGFSSFRLRNEKKLGESQIAKLRSYRKTDENGNNAESIVGIVSIDTICNLLNCQPGDLLEYIPEPAENKEA